MTPFYDKCVSVVLKSEGGYQCHPSDRGNYTPDGRLVGTKYGIAARCVSPESRVLTIDFRWVRADALKVGDKIISFNPDPIEIGPKFRMRKFQIATIENVAPDYMPCSRIYLKNGDTIICSNDHLWFAQVGSHKIFQWIKTKDLLIHPTTRGVKWRQCGTKTYLNKIFEPWCFDESRDAGYLAGFLDGEGCVSGYQVGFYQRENACLSEVLEICDNLSIPYRYYGPNKGTQTYRMANPNKHPHHQCEIIGSLGCKRLIARHLSKIEERRIDSNHTKRIEVEKVEPIGFSDVIKIKSSTGTLFVDGYASHNSFPQEDIKNLTKERAKYLIWKHYWKPMNLEGLVSDDLILHLFDFGFNAGKRLSVRTLQKLILTKADGIIGPITTRKANEFPCVIKCGTPYDLVDFFREARKVYYMDLANRKPQYKVFLKGWLNRIEKTKFDETV